MEAYGFGSLTSGMGGVGNDMRIPLLSECGPPKGDYCCLWFECVPQPYHVGLQAVLAHGKLVLVRQLQKDVRRRYETSKFQKR